jgi:hypothetical protein
MGIPYYKFHNFVKFGFDVICLLRVRFLKDPNELTGDASNIAGFLFGARDQKLCTGEVMMHVEIWF